MPNKFNLNHNEISKLLDKKKGMPVYAGKDGNLLEAEIIDFLDEEIISRWQPLNNNAKQLVLSMEACKDILFYKEQLFISNTRRRALKRMVVPICNLIDIAKRIIIIYNKDEEARAIRESNWPLVDIQTYKKLSKRINKINAKSTIRRLRNKQSAHLDTDIFSEEMIMFKLEDILEPLADSLIIIMLSINYPSEFFSWIRFLGKTESLNNIIETMYSYPLCTRWIIDEESKVKDIDSFHLALDPRHEVSAELQNVIKAYNEIISITKCNLNTIYMVPSEELKKD